MKTCTAGTDSRTPVRYSWDASRAYRRTYRGRVGGSNFGGERQCGELDECNSGSSRDRGVPIPQIMQERVQQRTVKEIIDVPVQQVLEGNVQVVQIAHLKRVSEGIFTDCRCATAPDLKEIVDPS